MRYLLTKICTIKNAQQQEMNTSPSYKEIPMPSIWFSLIPIASLITMLTFSVITFGVDTLAGASQLTLLVSAGIAAAIGMGVYKLSWKHIEESFISSISPVMPSILLLLLIGALSGAWMCSGIVPGFIYYGTWNSASRDILTEPNAESPSTM